MANSRYEYVKKFEQHTTLLPKTWIVVRIDGRGFHKFTTKHGFEKPNDARGLGLMNAAAMSVMRELPDICLAYGISDEYRAVRETRKVSIIFAGGIESRLISNGKLITTVVSTFTASYIHTWSKFFPDTELTLPLPTFDGRAVLYPDIEVLRDYMNWRQVDCHINNLYNTVFWALMQQGGLTTTEAEEQLKGTLASDKNEILFSRFGINYNNEPEMYKKGNILYRKFEDDEAPKKSPSRTQQEKQRKRKSKASIELVHVDLIQDTFWEERPWILS